MLAYNTPSFANLPWSSVEPDPSRTGTRGWLLRQQVKKHFTDNAKSNIIPSNRTTNTG